MKKQKVFIIGGPTASGKSELALRLAEKLNGTLVNGDAIQVYRDLAILSARPDKADLTRAPHYLYGEVDAWTNFSLADWLKRIQETVPNLKNPIVVGGTGLYLNTLMEGINEIPDVDTEIREKVRHMSLDEVKSMVKDCPFSDPQRLRRSLEVQLSCGKPISYFYNQPKKKLLAADFHCIYVLPPKEKVYQNCAKRFDNMIETGALKEVENLLKIKATGGVLKAIGVPEIIAYLQKNCSKQEMRQKAILATKHYAKRQMTWFRHHGEPKHIVTDITQVNISDITK